MAVQRNISIGIEETSHSFSSSHCFLRGRLRRGYKPVVLEVSSKSKW